MAERCAAGLDPLFVPVVVRLAKRLQPAAEKQNRVATVRPDVIDDGRADVAFPFGPAEAAVGMRGELLGASCLPSGRLVERAVKRGALAALITS